MLHGMMEVVKSQTSVLVIDWPAKLYFNLSVKKQSNLNINNFGTKLGRSDLKWPDVNYLQGLIWDTKYTKEKLRSKPELNQQNGEQI